MNFTPSPLIFLSTAFGLTCSHAQMVTNPFGTSTIVVGENGQEESFDFTPPLSQLEPYAISFQQSFELKDGVGEGQLSDLRYGFEFFDGNLSNQDAAVRFALSTSQTNGGTPTAAVFTVYGDNNQPITFDDSGQQWLFQNFAEVQPVLFSYEILVDPLAQTYDLIVTRQDTSEALTFSDVAWPGNNVYDPNNGGTYRNGEITFLNSSGLSNSVVSQIKLTQVPEPSVLAVTLLPLAGMLLGRRRRA
ncbi:MAG: hypothetical protein Q7Q71_11065 [Verrucomicrobiota bacterium JB023]|nr:hypothetical protein [Verrucomicrobiota bacterium JB023]